MWFPYVWNNNKEKEMLSQFRLGIRLLLLLVAIYGGVGIVVGAVLRLCVPWLYFDHFPLVPLFYLVTGVVLNFVLDACRNKHPDRLVNMFMFMRMVKLVLTVAFLGIYDRFIGEHKMKFALTLVLFYLIYMSLESYLFYLYEKRRKKHETKHPELPE